MSALGALVVSLSLEHAAFSKGLDKSSQEALKFANNAQRSIDQFERNVSDKMSSAAKSVLGIITATVGVTAAFRAFNAAVGNLAGLDDLAQKTGASVEKLSQMQRVARAFGQDFSVVDASITKLARGIGNLDDDSGKANTALKALGISSKDLSGNLRDPAEITVEVAKKLQNYRDDASKAAIATDLFGKSGAEIIPYLNDLADNVDRFSGVSAEAAARAAAFQDKLSDIKDKASTAFEALAIYALPTLDAVLNKFIQNAEKGQVFIGVLESLAELGKSAVFGDAETRRAAQIQNVNKRILSDIDKLNALKRAGRNEEAAALAKDIQTQKEGYKELIKIQSESYDKNNPASPYESPKGGEALKYLEAERIKREQERLAKEAASKAEADAKRTFGERLKALQDEVTEEAENADIIRVYKSSKEKELAEYKSKLEKELNAKSEEMADKAQTSAGRYEQEIAKKRLDSIKEQERAYERMAGEVSQAFTNGLFDSFKKGESFGTAMVRNIVALAQTWFARMFQSLLTNSGSIVSSLFSGASGAGSLVPTTGGSGGGIGSIFGSIKDIFTSTNGSIVSSIESLGTFLSSGEGGLGDILGGFLGENAAAIADGFGYLGAALQLAQGNIGGAAGTAIGTLVGGPVGGAIGSILGSALGGLFGGGLPPRVSESRSATTSGGITRFFEGADPGKRKLGASSQLDALNETFAKNINVLLSAFGVDDEIYSNALLTKKVNTRARFGFNIGDTRGGFAYEQSFGKNGDFGTAFNALVENALGKVTVKAIQGSSLPEGIKKFFDGLIKKEDVVATINGVISLTASLKNMPPVFDAIRNAIDTTLYTTPIAKLQEQFQAVTTYTSLFYTQAENFATFTDQLNSQFEALNIAMPQTRDGFRELVDGIDVVDKSTSDQFNSLVGLAPAMDAYFKQLEQQKEIVEQTTGALRDLNSFTSLAEYRQYKGVAASYGSTFALDNTANFRTGALSNNAAGQGVVTSTGSSDVVRLLQELRDLFKQNTKSASDQVDLLDTFSRIGIPTRA